MKLAAFEFENGILAMANVLNATTDPQEREILKAELKKHIDGFPQPLRFVITQNLKEKGIEL